MYDNSWGTIASKLEHGLNCGLRADRVVNITCRKEYLFVTEIESFLTLLLMLRVRKINSSLDC